MDDAASMPDYVESVRGSTRSRLIDANLQEIRRGSVDLGSGGAVPAADMTTRNGSKSKFDRMSRTMTNFGGPKYGSQAEMKGHRSSISPRPNRQSIGMDDYKSRKPDDATTQLSAALNSIRKTKGRALENSKKIIDKFAYFNG